MTSRWLIDVWRTPDLAGLDAILRDDVRFRSPYADYQGRPTVEHLLRLIVRVLGQLQISGRHESVAGTTAASSHLSRTTRFTATVEGHDVQGVLCEDVDRSGQLTDAMLLLRPYPGLRVAMRAMNELLAQDPLPSVGT